MSSERDRAAAPIGARKCEILANSDSGSYRLITALDRSGPLPEPGQFYMLATADGWGGELGRPYLPRAFSFAQATPANEGVQLGLLAEDVGPGTATLCRLSPGDGLRVTGPLGSSFSDPNQLTEAARGAILVGGGIGVAPLAALRARLREGGTPVTTLLGYRGRHRHGGLELFSSSGGLCTGVKLAFEDGSLGHHGYVTDLLAVMLEGDDAGSAAVFACGPPAMLEAIRVMCAERQVAAELALEAPMACGFGACMGCAVSRPDGGYMRLCIDGPVVNASEIDSALIPGAGH
jgi:dihydroorotate dehydrogenase electron transfer subunit